MNRAWHDARACSNYRVKCYLQIREVGHGRGGTPTDDRGPGQGDETIRFYEQVGLLPAPHRSPGGYRLYGSGHVTRLTFVRRARELGFFLAEVRTMLRLADERAQPCADVRVVATAHLRDVRARIADLQAMERVLRTTVARCARGTGSDCPLLDALSRARCSGATLAPSRRRPRRSHSR